MNILYEWVLRVVLILLLLIVIWCMYDNYYVFSHTLDNSYLKYKPTSTPDAIPPEENPISDDMTAWLTIDNTNIDYPVMQGSDNVKYLNTNPFGQYSLSGSIFLDSRNASDFTDDYSIIYGHHMEYGVMFGALENFLDENYLRTHQTGTLIIGKNAEKTYQLKVFASMKTNASNSAVFDIQQEETRQFIKEHAVVYTNEQDARILCLSTCAEGEATSRLTVFCYILS